MVEYPKKDSWCIGFVSSHAKEEIGSKLGTSKIGVFVPTTPNPTSGFLIYVEESETVPLEMTVEEGAKMILTAGLVVPEYESTDAAGSVVEPQIGTQKLAEQA